MKFTHTCLFQAELIAFNSQVRIIVNVGGVFKAKTEQNLQCSAIYLIQTFLMSLKTLFLELKLAFTGTVKLRMCLSESVHYSKLN